MNHPTREEFEELAEKVRRLEQQHTEPITIPRIELDPGGIQNRLDNHAEMMREIDRKSDVHTRALVLLEQKMNNGFLAMEQRFNAIAEVQKLILEKLDKQ